MNRSVAGVTLFNILNDDKYKQLRKSIDSAVDAAIKYKYEYGGVVYINDQTGAIKLAGPKTANPPQVYTSDLEQFVQIPQGYTRILAAYHAHPGPTSVNSCAPSGISDNKDDVGKAKSAPWNAGFFLVATGYADPKRPRELQGKCAVVGHMDSGTNKYRLWYVQNVTG